jgi:transcriptional antiterminator NusG
VLEIKMNDERDPDGMMPTESAAAEFGDRQLESTEPLAAQTDGAAESDGADLAEQSGDENVHDNGGLADGEVGEESHQEPVLGSDDSADDVAAGGAPGGPALDPDDDLPPVDDDAEPVDPSSLPKSWYILKAQVNRETSVCDTLRRRVQRFGLGGYFGEMLVPTEDVREFTKAGKSRIVKRKLYPGYIMVNMALTEESWWLVRDTPGIGDFTSMGGKPTPLGEAEFDKILKASRPLEVEEGGKKDDIKTSIKHKVGDKVRVKDGNFENFEGEVSAIDERNGRVTVLINIFGRLNPVELDHWQVEGI